MIAPLRAQPDPKDIGVLTCMAADTNESVPLGAGPVPPGAGESAPGKSLRLLCTFKPREDAPEETYVGVIQLVGEIGPLDGRAMMWTVKGSSVPVAPAGLLQQTYSPSGQQQAGQVTPLTGDDDNSLILQSMSEQAEGIPKTEAPGVVITAMALTLKASSA
jgi:hypothetical protein